jgi:hypothetical protein
MVKNGNDELTCLKNETLFKTTHEIVMYIVNKWYDMN